MRQKIFLFAVFFLTNNLVPDTAFSAEWKETEKSDSIEKQILYNGRAWRNIYYKVRGDQFLFSAEFLKGEVLIEGKKFSNLQLKYDIYKDELLLITEGGIIIQLNREMVDQFWLNYNNLTYNFKRLDSDSTNSLSGYVNVLYEGNISLYVKYIKELLILAVENKYDLFHQINKIYFKTNGRIIQINSKREFLRLLQDHKQQIHSFIRDNRIKLSRKDPQGYKPVIEYYDKLPK